MPAKRTRAPRQTVPSEPPRSTREEVARAAGDDRTAVRPKARASCARAFEGETGFHVLARRGNGIAHSTEEARSFAFQVAGDAPELRPALVLAFRNESTSPHVANASMRAGRTLFKYACVESASAAASAQEALAGLLGAGRLDRGLLEQPVGLVANELRRAIAALQRADARLVAIARGLPEAPERSARRGPERSDALLAEAARCLRRVHRADGKALNDRQIGMLFAAAGIGAFSPRASDEEWRQAVRDLSRRR